jgi:uncharacterized membrane protein
MTLFIKILTYASAILLPIAIIIGLVFLFIKFGATSIFDNITKNARKFLDFSVMEFIRILVVIFDHSTNVVLLGLLWVLNNAVVVQHADSSIVRILCFCIFGCTITVFKKGDGMEKYLDILTGYFKKNSKDANPVVEQ